MKQWMLLWHDIQCLPQLNCLSTHSTTTLICRCHLQDADMYKSIGRLQRVLALQAFLRLSISSLCAYCPTSAPSRPPQHQGAGPFIRHGTSSDGVPPQAGTQSSLPVVSVASVRGRRSGGRRRGTRAVRRRLYVILDSSGRRQPSCALPACAGRRGQGGLAQGLQPYAPVPPLSVPLASASTPSLSNPRHCSPTLAGTARVRSTALPLSCRNHR